MKLFYYLFGIITALFAFMVVFDLYSYEFMDDYWITLLSTVYAKEWWYSNITISVLFISFALVWVYNLGRGVTEEEKLLIENIEDDNKEQID